MCANFNSAFVALMRASGIPSRMVSGFAVANSVDYQEVFADQAHAWAEVKFNDLGWVEFDATGSGICDCCAPIQNDSPPPTPSPTPTPTPTSTPTPTPNPTLMPTFTEITKIQPSAVKGETFLVNGTVVDRDGKSVSGMHVLIHFKVSKNDESGILVGDGDVSSGNFAISCLVPVESQVGEYHVIASAIENEKYRGSESDPIIKVRSETTIDLSKFKRRRRR